MVVNQNNQKSLRKNKGKTTSKLKLSEKLKEKSLSAATVFFFRSKDVKCYKAEKSGYNIFYFSKYMRRKTAAIVRCTT